MRDWFVGPLLKRVVGGVFGGGWWFAFFRGGVGCGVLVCCWGG
ncbi:hypothetical protein [Pseudomonas syringae group genomosp. 7]